MLHTDSPTILTAAERAWQTRRLKAQARADVQTLKAGVTTASPAGDAAMVSMNIENALGSGERRYLVVDLGTKWVVLFYAPSLQRVRVDRLTFDRIAKPVGFGKRVLTQIIRANIEERQRLFPADCKQRVGWAREALRTLSGVRGGKRVETT